MTSDDAPAMTSCSARLEFAPRRRLCVDVGVEEPDWRVEKRRERSFSLAASAERLAVSWALRYCVLEL